MNPNIQALLDLQVIDKQRLTYKQAREAKLVKLAETEKALKAAEAAALAAQGDVDRAGALSRQYTLDVERCDRTVAEFKGKQPEAKTNKEYMDLINGIEAAKLEKVKRESSLKELQTRIAELQAKADAQALKATQAKATHEAVVAEAGAAQQPSSAEAALQQQYDELRTKVDAAFLEHYERLIKARHKTPLLRVDPATRATPFGTLLSPNYVEQLRANKLVIDRTTNAILYLG